MCPRFAGCENVALPTFAAVLLSSCAAVGFVMGMVFGVLTRLFLRFMRCADWPETLSATDVPQFACTSCSFEQGVWCLHHAALTTKHELDVTRRKTSPIWGANKRLKSLQPVGCTTCVGLLGLPSNMCRIPFVSVSQLNRMQLNNVSTLHLQQ
jgi:hypothetical protein